ncbi:hypothetical protein [Nocardia noduli]|uniref:hypothetical protein n=1 Tax=Nocardia noduli TaxID=2815722 RepID=UPI001C21F6D4|nr:hypothetical protein [Nocardia noduli]
MLNWMVFGPWQVIPQSLAEVVEATAAHRFAVAVSQEFGRRIGSAAALDVMQQMVGQ